ncbi:hypothetical protein B9J76_08700 [Lacticaseibacillus paracasei]|nr:hypothetical protein CFM84_09965 [Lacticaseibacillus paracasei]OSP84310.1 hypothetical protein B9J76_08700 [Lacticaseibacillus paracasei]TJY18269.1 hypothetical protein FCF24_14265 [Lacticaseibacillus paracasei]
MALSVITNKKAASSRTEKVLDSSACFLVMIKLNSRI